ncbi:MAG: hypothetical protein PVI23_07815 [Maricaulaceae bacterium]|jgi:hypothetical protein
MSLFGDGLRQPWVWFFAAALAVAGLQTTELGEIGRAATLRPYYLGSTALFMAGSGVLWLAFALIARWRARKALWLGWASFAIQALGAAATIVGLSMMPPPVDPAETFASVEAVTGDVSEGQFGAYLVAASAAYIGGGWLAMISNVAIVPAAIIAIAQSRPGGLQSADLPANTGA